MTVPTDSTTAKENTVGSIITPSSVPSAATTVSQIPREETRIDPAKNNVTSSGDTKIPLKGTKTLTTETAKTGAEIARDVLSTKTDATAKKVLDANAPKNPTINTTAAPAVKDNEKEGVKTPLSLGVSLICLQGLDFFEDKVKQAQRAVRNVFLSTREVDNLMSHIGIARHRIEKAPTDRGRRMVAFTENLLRATTNGLQFLGMEVEKTRQREEDQQIDTVGSEQKLKAIRDTLLELGDQRDLFPKREDEDAPTDRTQMSLPGTETPKKTAAEAGRAGGLKSAAKKAIAKKAATKKARSTSAIRPAPKPSQKKKK